MKSLPFLFTVCILSFFGVGCSQKTALKGPPIHSNSSFEQAVAATDLSPGIRTGKFTMDQGAKWTYSLSVPTLATEKYPLVLALHWAGPDKAYFGEQHLRCLMEPGLRELNAIIFAPDAQGELWWNTPMDKRIEQFITYATKHWPVDSDRIVVAGYSNGGIGAWHYVRRYPDVFSAAIPLAAAVHNLDAVRVPVFAIHGEQDELFNFTKVQTEVQEVARNSTNVRFLAATNRSHYDGCAYVPELQQAANWLLEEVWK